MSKRERKISGTFIWVRLQIIRDVHDNTLGHFGPVSVTCGVVLLQHLRYKAFCVRPVQKPVDSKASDPLTSPLNAQFYPLTPNKQLQSHHKQPRRQTLQKAKLLHVMTNKRIIGTGRVNVDFVNDKRKKTVCKWDKFAF